MNETLDCEIPKSCRYVPAIDYFGHCKFLDIFFWNLGHILFLQFDAYVLHA